MNTAQIISQIDKSITQLRRLKDAFESTDDVPELIDRYTHTYTYTHIRDAITKIKDDAFTLDQVKAHLPDDVYFTDRTIGSTILNSGYVKKQISINGRRVWHYIRLH